MARGKYAKAISDRSGMEFPYLEMVREWNGFLVHRSEFESKHPQLEISSKKLTTFKGGKNSFGRYLVGKFLKQSSKWGERIENNKYSVWFEFMAIEGKKI